MGSLGPSIQLVEWMTIREHQSTTRLCWSPKEPTESDDVHSNQSPPAKHSWKESWEFGANHCQCSPFMQMYLVHSHRNMHRVTPRPLLQKWSQSFPISDAT